METTPRLLTTALLLSGVISAPLSAAVFTVTTTADNVTLPPPGSLRWAIQMANLTPGADTIVFAIPGFGVQTIVLQGALPPLTDPAGVRIDGLTQAGANAGPNPPTTAVLMIELDGALAGPATGISIWSDNNTVQGLVVNRFSREGIHIEGQSGTTADNNVVFCNFVGTDPTGNIGMGNGGIGGPLLGGIHISNVPGGSARFNMIDRNLSSHNWAEGIWVEGPRVPGDVGFNHVTDNYVGTDITGTVDLGNHHEGIALTEGTHDNHVIHNLVSGNDTDGIGLQGYDNFLYPAPPIYTHHNLIADNLVGVDINIQPLPNSMNGIAIGSYGPGRWGFANFNTIRNNVVANNGGDGVAVVETFNVNFANADNNEITQNSIWANQGLGIDLDDDGVTPNGPPDIRANQDLDYPLITNIVYNVFTTTISGAVSIPNPTQARVELFYAQADPTGFGEGQWYLGSTPPNAAGNWSLTTNLVVPGDSITATVTDFLSNTSEFAANLIVPGAAALTIDVPVFPARLGGMANLSLNAGAANAGRQYLVVCSLSGTTPGTPLGSVTVPIVADPWTNVVIAFTNSPAFSNFFGSLDATGQATAQINLLGALNPSWVGAVFHYAFVLFPFNFASNPIAHQVTGW